MGILPLCIGTHLGNTTVESLFKVPSLHLSSQSPSTLKPLSHVTVTEDPSITSFGNIDPCSISIAWHSSEKIQIMVAVIVLGGFFEEQERNMSKLFDVGMNNLNFVHGAC